MTLTCTSTEHTSYDFGCACIVHLQNALKLHQVPLGTNHEFSAEESQKHKDK
eukprot:m.1118150 g.1118150  ORF g.1118150 m.1118150 type:complete len:52 (+) comp24382_c1_seq3:238-393(+)